MAALCAEGPQSPMASSLYSNTSARLRQFKHDATGEAALQRMYVQLCSPCSALSERAMSHHRQKTITSRSSGRGPSLRLWCALGLFNAQDSLTQCPSCNLKPNRRSTLTGHTVLATTNPLEKFLVALLYNTVWCVLLSLTTPATHTCDTVQ